MFNVLFRQSEMLLSSNGIPFRSNDVALCRTKKKESL